ncbi:MAG: hypothetical protein V3U45_08305 [bacterium]
MKLTNEWVKLTRRASAKVHLNQGGISIPQELAELLDGVERVDLWRLHDRAVLIVPADGRGTHKLTSVATSRRSYIATHKLRDLKGKYSAAWSEIEIGKRTVNGLYVAVQAVKE